MEFSHDNSHSLASEFANLIWVPRDCTNWVQLEHDYIGKVLVFSGIFRGCSKHRLLKHSSKHSSHSITLQAFLRVQITSVEDIFWECSPSCGDVQRKGQLEDAEWPLVVPGSQFSPHSSQPYVPSLLAVLAQGAPSGRGCHIPLGKEWTHLYWKPTGWSKSEQNVSLPCFQACHPEQQGKKA